MAMSPERWGQLKEMFRVAMEYDPRRREAYLAQACVGDDALRAEIESLLTSHDRAENFIESPAFTDAVKALTESPVERIATRGFTAQSGSVAPTCAASAISPRYTDM